MLSFVAIDAQVIVGLGIDFVAHWLQRSAVGCGGWFMALDAGTLDLVTFTSGCSGSRGGSGGSARLGGAGGAKGGRDCRHVHHLGLFGVHCAHDFHSNDTIGVLIEVEDAPVAAEGQSPAERYER